MGLSAYGATRRLAGMSSGTFIPANPTVEDCWRGVILYGKNSATYKFALASALLELNPRAGRLLKMEDLALPFASSVAKHLAESPKQGTNPRSRFLSACSGFNVDHDQGKLVDATLAYGFQNVIDAFHTVGLGPVLHRFYVDERKENQGIRITDEFAKLTTGIQRSNLEVEVGSRWRLVETAWNLGISANHLVVEHDHELGEIFTFDSARRRKAVTSSRGALNGYQKGRCFYCFADLRLLGEDFNTDVDHFFPHKLKPSNPQINIDGVWNLVLSCQACNRGPRGKFDRIPSLRLLERLHARNEFLIGSHHPLRETLMNQTGSRVEDRVAYLNGLYREVQLNPQTAWEPEVRGISGIQ